MLLFLCLLIGATISSISLCNDETSVYTVDGKNECSIQGFLCTSLSQATEVITKAASEVSFQIIVAVSVSDTTERPIKVTKSLSILELEGCTVTITNNTANTSSFCTIQPQNSEYPISVTCTGFQFLLNARGQYVETEVTVNDIIGGHIFSIPETTAQVRLTLSSMSFVSGNADGSPAVCSGSLLYAASGSLTLSSVSIALLSLAKSAAVFIQHANCYIRGGCTFSHISSFGQEATSCSALYAQLQDGDELTITGVSFVDCTSHVNGGAMAVYLSGSTSSVITIGGMKYNEEVQFSRCSTPALGGAMFFHSTLLQYSLACFRVDYAQNTARYAHNLAFVMSEPFNLEYSGMMLNQLLKGQDPKLYEFMAWNVTDPIDMYMASVMYSYIVPLSSSGSDDCECTRANHSCTACKTLSRALYLTTQTYLPVGTGVTIQPGTTLVPSNFTGTAYSTATIRGNNMTVQLGITSLIEAPILSVGPAIQDIEIRLTVQDLTFNIQRTDAVYLRQKLFQVHNTLLQEDSTGKKSLVRASGIHYFELNRVTIQSANSVDPDTGLLIPATTSEPIVDADEGTYLLFKNVVFSDLKSIDIYTSSLATSPIIQAQNAVCVLVSSKFRRITLTDSPLLSVSPILDNFGIEMPTGVQSYTEDTVTVFSDVVRISGDGGILSLSLATNGTATELEPYLFILQNAYFTKCSVSQGKGGVLYISSLDSASQISLSNLLFSGCKAEQGNCIYVKSDSVSASELSVEWANIEGDDILPNDYVLQSSTGTVVPIFDHTANEHVIMVDIERGSDEGTSDGPCGSAATVPCATIYLAYTNRKDVTTTIALAPGTYAPDVRPITFTSSITVKGEASSRNFVMKDMQSVKGGCFLISETLVNGVITFELITFTLISEALLPGVTGVTASALSCPAILCQSSSLVSLNSVAFVLKKVSDPLLFQHADIAGHIIEASAGVIQLNDVAFSSLSFPAGMCLIDTTHAKLLMADCTFSDITLSTRPLISPSGSPEDLVFLSNFEGSTNSFTNIVRLSGNGAVLEMELAEHKGLILQHAQFINCTCTETEYVDTELTILGNKAYAGALFFNLLGYNGTFSLDPSTVTFSLSASSPYFDDTFNAPWKSAISFASQDGTYFWLTDIAEQRESIDQNSYAYHLTTYDPDWSGANEGRYYFYSLDSEGSKTHNNTLAYTITNHLRLSTEAVLTTTGTDVIGCGLSGHESIPCCSVQQAFANLNPSASSEKILIHAGTYSGTAVESTYITAPCIISGTISRSRYHTFITLTNPAFFTTTNTTDMVTIANLSLTLITGTFVTNTGESGVYLHNLAVAGIPKASVLERTYSPFFTSTTGPVTFNRLSVSNITLTDCTMAVISGGSLLITDCTFTDIFPHSPGTGGGVIDFTVTTSHSLTILGSDFTNCQTQLNGGALYITLRTPGDITISSPGHPVTFNNCSAVKNGGAIYFNALQRWSLFSTPELTFSGAFDGETFAEAQNGIYIYYQSGNKIADINYNDVMSNIDAYDFDDNTFVANTTTSSGPTPMIFLRTLVYMDNSPDSLNDSSCGTEKHPCITLSSALGSSLRSESVMFVLNSSAFPASDSTVSITKELNLYGLQNENGDEPRINVTTIPDTEPTSSNADLTYERPIFTVTGDGISLYISKVHFFLIPSSGSNLFENPFMVVTDGAECEFDTVNFTVFDPTVPLILQHPLLSATTAYYIQFHSTHISNFTLEDCPLIQPPFSTSVETIESSGLFSNYFSVFENITRNKGNGAVFEVTMRPGDVLHISNYNFSFCEAKQGNGGAVAITYTGGCLIIGDDEESQRVTSFHSCSALKGGAFYVNLTVKPGTDEMLLLQSFITSGSSETSVGKYVFAEGPEEAIKTIPLWQPLIKPERVPGLYQFRVADEDTISNMYDLVPSVIYIATSGDPAATDDGMCTLCKAIRFGLASHNKAARTVYLYPGDRHAAFFTMLDHDVIITGESASVSAPQYNQSFVDSNNNRWPQPIYFLCTGEKITSTLQSFDIYLNASDPQYYDRYCSTPGGCEQIILFKVTTGASLVLDLMRILNNVNNPPKDVYERTLVQAEEGSLLIKDTSFDTISLVNCPLMKVNTSPGKFDMVGSNYFNKIESSLSTNSEGALVTLDLSGGDGIKLRNASFHGCTYNQGSLIYIALYDEPVEGLLVLQNLHFDYSLSSSQSYNADRYFFTLQTALTDYVIDNGQIWTSLLASQSYPAHSFRLIVTDEVEDGVAPVPLQTLDLANYRYKSFYVDPSSSSTSCSKSTPCEYLHYAADLGNRAQVEEVHIYISEGTLDNDQMKGAFLRTMTISGSVDDLGVETYLSVTKEGTGSLALLSVGVSEKEGKDSSVTFANLSVLVQSTVRNTVYLSVFGVVSQSGLIARLILDTVTFDLDTNIAAHEHHSSITKPLINAASGSLLLKDTTFSHLMFLNTPALCVSPKRSLTTLDGITSFNESTDFVCLGTNRFENITNDGGNGGVLSLVLSSNQYAFLSHCTFHSCSANLGGALYIEIPENVTESNIDFDVDTLIFEFQGTITDGTYLYLRTYDERYVSAEYNEELHELIHHVADVKHDFVLEYIHNGTSLTYQLYETFDDAVTVSLEENALPSMDEAITLCLHNPTHQRIFTKIDLPSQTIPAVFQSDLYMSAVKADRTRTVIPITNIASGTILYTVLTHSSAPVTLTCNDMSFVYSSTPEHTVAGSVFGIMNDTCTLILSSTTVTVDSSQSKLLPLSSPFISALAGTLGLSNLQANNLNLLNTSLFTLPSNLNHFSIFTTCYFTNISRSIGSGSIFSETVEASDTLTLKNIHFTNCKCDAGDGGAVALTLRFRSGLSLESVSFTSCATVNTSPSSTHSNSESGKGGGVYLFLEGKPDTLHFTHVTLTECAASLGNSIYFDCTNIDPYSNEDWSSLLEQVSGVSEGDVVSAVVDSSSSSSSLIDLGHFISQSALLPQQSASQDETSSFSTRILIVVIILSTTAIFFVILLLCCCCRKKN